jgi:hypothetical protein
LQEKSSSFESSKMRVVGGKSRMKTDLEGPIGEESTEAFWLEGSAGHSPEARAERLEHTQK